MRRVQLFEFLDQSWLPGSIRVAAARYLETAYRSSPFPALWAEKLAGVLRGCAIQQIVDIGSGSGGPIEPVIRHLARPGYSPRVILTDLYPIVSTSSFAYWPEPVDARCVPAELRGVRTLFTVFHHLGPASARAVLRDAFEKGQPICIFEATARTPGAVASAFVIPLMVLLVTPSIRPLSVFQIVFTYLIPLLPLIFFWDGFVSQLRSYSGIELGELSEGMTSGGYGWEFGSIQARGVPYSTSYAIGCMKGDQKEA